MAIVLASQSPRRQELLARIGVEDFKTLSLDIDESYPEGLSPEDTVRGHGCRRALRARRSHHHGGHDGLFGQ